MIVVRAFFRHFREAMQRAEISVWPITVRLDFARERTEPRIKAGFIAVPVHAGSAAKEGAS